jgi:mannose-6-phosphate isomerase-like protein (cupin superfamily)
MDIQAINISDKFVLLDKFWSPRIITQMNDYHFKLVKIQGDFIWHSHPDTDEVFIVLKGEMGIEFRDFHRKISEGELLVVPRGVEHKPYAESECHVMLVEPAGTPNTGDAGGERTADVDQWI